MYAIQYFPLAVQWSVYVTDRERTFISCTFISPGKGGAALEEVTQRSYGISISQGFQDEVTVDLT